ncbi:glycosyltransferase [Arthrobacter bambusae]|uniref:glycosyltransferase n=1 Tax=Arthrobacter bambusae TaxID=1338426 RepID=UPI00277E6EDE|nr:glycosyltransferase [Arthrobacter bambusae]MDQ0240165.1 UDP-N-acetylglucosamine transferase subunit ALG13 [Arthrobacter bambusae]
MTVMLIAGSGGHLTQLKILADRIPDARDRIWVTDRTPQSESLLRDERVVFLPHQAPRSIIGLVKNAWILSQGFEPTVSRMYSTGAGIALSGVLVAYLRRVKFTYIESATRVSSLSLSGKVINWLPFVERFVQHDQIAKGRWKNVGSVFDGFLPTARFDQSSTETLSVFVTVGANQHIGFDRLIRDLHSLIPPSWSAYWQYGPTNIDGLDLNGKPTLSAVEMARQLESADVVVSHAGTGSILSALMAGKIPIVVPRTASTGEHVDQHQEDLAGFASEKGLAIVRDSSQITVEEMIAASRLAATRAKVLDALPL